MHPYIIVDAGPFDWAAIVCFAGIDNGNRGGIAFGADCEPARNRGWHRISGGEIRETTDEFDLQNRSLFGGFISSCWTARCEGAVRNRPADGQHYVDDVVVR